MRTADAFLVEGSARGSSLWEEVVGCVRRGLGPTRRSRSGSLVGDVSDEARAAPLQRALRRARREAPRSALKTQLSDDGITPAVCVASMKSQSVSPSYIRPSALKW